MIARLEGLAALAIFTMVAGCGWLPSAGPTARTVDEQATVNGQPQFTVVEVDDHVVNAVEHRRTASFSSTFGRFGRPRPATISVGDTVVVSIWESGPDPLFGASLAIDHGVTTGSHSVTLPQQVVPVDGMITVPFVGRVLVKGRTLAQAQQMIQSQLTGKTASPQVIVTVPRSTSNTVTVAGEVVKGARVPLSPEGDRLLDVIATAGGAQAPIYDVYVRLTRRGRTTTIPYQTLVDTPAENLYAWPGDVLTLVRIPRSFVALGATGRNAQINFDQQKLNVAQALAKSAGLVDEKADPAGVFLLREEPGSLLQIFNRGSETEWNRLRVPVVYHFDLHDTKAYFLAQHFPVENNDIVYVAPAQANAIQKFFGLLATITNPIVTGIIVNSNVH